MRHRVTRRLSDLEERMQPEHRGKQQDAAVRPHRVTLLESGYHS